MPKVSVIMPTYNCSKFISQAVESVLGQTFKDFEVIIIDDGSADNTKEVLGQFRDNKITYIYQENRGVASARNAGIRASRGEFVAFLDADDLWLPDKLELQTQILENNPQVGLAFTDIKFIDEEGKAVPVKDSGKKYTGKVFRELVLSNFITTASSVMVRKTCLDKVGLFDKDCVVGEDFHCWLRFAKDYEFYWLPKPLTLYRRVSGTLTDKAGVAEVYKMYQKVLSDPLLASDITDLKERIRSRMFFEAGLFYYGKGRMKRAREEFRRAIRIFPYQIDPYIFFAKSFAVVRAISTISSLRTKFWGFLKTLSGEKKSSYS